MAHSANKLKHTPSTKLALEDVLKSLQDLIRNDLPPADTAPREMQPESAPLVGIAQAPTATEVLRELEAELEAMPSADELDLSGLDLQPAEELTLGTDEEIVEEISLSEPPETEEITLLALPEETSPTPLDIEPPRSEYLQDNAPSGADLSGLEGGGLDIDVEPGPGDGGLEIQSESLILEPMPEELFATLPAEDASASLSDYLQDDAPSGVELSVLEGHLPVVVDLPPPSAPDAPSHTDPLPITDPPAPAATLPMDITDDFLKADMPLAELAETDAPANEPTANETTTANETISLEPPVSAPAPAAAPSAAHSRPGAKAAAAAAPAIPREGLQTELSFTDAPPANPGKMAVKPAPALSPAPASTPAPPIPTPALAVAADNYGAISYNPPSAVSQALPTPTVKPATTEATVNWQDIPVLQDAIEMPARVASPAPAVAPTDKPVPKAANNGSAPSTPTAKNDHGHKIAIQVAARLNVELRRSGKRGLGSDIITRLARVLEETLAQPAPNMDNTPKRKD